MVEMARVLLVFLNLASLVPNAIIRASFLNVFSIAIKIFIWKPGTLNSALGLEPKMLSDIALVIPGALMDGVPTSSENNGYL